jgi:chorismate dehydratase
MIKLAAVSYLNTKPLLRGLTCDIIKTVPAKLLPIFESGRVDAALLSLYDILQLPQPELVDNIAIGCRGAVYSVVLAYEGALQNIEKVQLDPASHTSNQLLKIILKNFYQLDPEFVEKNDVDDLDMPALVIGDAAIALRQRASCSFLDLGEEWYRFTGLPFVFARWCLKKGQARQQEITLLLQQAKERGLRERAAIASSYHDPEFALRYFTEYIHYDYGAEEGRAVELFRTLLQTLSYLGSVRKV